MRKILIFIAFLTLVAFTPQAYARSQDQACAQDRVEIIRKEFMPVEAQDFLGHYLRKWKIVEIVKRCELDYVKDHYTVTFKGNRVAEFDEMGTLVLLKGNGKAVPTGFLPTQMLNYLRENFIKQNVVSVRFDKRMGEWEARLDDRTKARFDILGFMIKVER